MLKKFFSITLCSLVLGLISCNFGGGKSEDVVVLFTNDMHCAVSNVIDDGSNDKDYYKSLGYAKIKAYKNLMDKTYGVIMVDAGDFSHGNGDGETMGSHTSGDGIIDIMQAVGYDYVVLGNHEFTYGLAAIKRYMDNLDATFLGCNIVPATGKTAADYPELSKLNTTYAKKSINGKMIAFIGVTTPESFKNITGGENSVNFTFEDKDALKTKVQKQVDDAKNDGADYVILITHMGLDEDTDGDDPSSDRYTSAELVKELKGVDVLLDGHSTLGVGETPAQGSKEEVNVSGYVLDSENKKVVYGHTGKFGKKLGKLLLSSPASGIKEITINYLDNDDLSSLEGDKIVADVVAKKLESTQKATNEKICSSSVTLSRFGMPSDVTSEDKADSTIDWSKFKNALVGETFTGALIADAYRDSTGAQIGIVNAGSIGKTPVTGTELNLANVISVVGSYYTKMATVKLKGSELKQILAWAAHALSNSAHTYTVGSPDTSTGMKKPTLQNSNPDFNGFLNVSGLKFEIDVSMTAIQEDQDTHKPTGNLVVSRIKNLQVLKTNAENDPSVAANWENVDDDTTYTVGMSSYMLTGDGYTQFFAGKDVTYPKDSNGNDLVDNVAFRNYLVKLQTLSNSSVKLGRIKVEQTI